MGAEAGKSERKRDAVRSELGGDKIAAWTAEHSAVALARQSQPEPTSPAADEEPNGR